MPAQAIHNPFGLGPGWFVRHRGRRHRPRGAARWAPTTPEGRAPLTRTIGAKWAPHRRVQRSRRAERQLDGRRRRLLRGPRRRPRPAGPAGRSRTRRPRASAPRPRPRGPARDHPGAAPTPAGPPVVTAWGGAPPASRPPRPPVAPTRPTARRRHRGLRLPPRPAAGRAAPTATPSASPARSTATGPATSARSPSRPPPVHTAVAVVAGHPAAGDAAEREEGIAFWIDTPAGDGWATGPSRLRRGLGEGAPVTAGRPSAPRPAGCASPGSAPAPIDPFPLLKATRPPS